MKGRIEWKQRILAIWDGAPGLKLSKSNIQFKTTLNVHAQESKIRFSCLSTANPETSLTSGLQKQEMVKRTPRYWGMKRTNQTDRGSFDCDASAKKSAWILKIDTNMIPICYPFCWWICILTPTNENIQIDNMLRISQSIPDMTAITSCQRSGNCSHAEDVQNLNSFKLLK